MIKRKKDNKLLTKKDLKGIEKSINNLDERKS